MHLGVALRAFFAALFSRETADRVAAALDGSAVPAAVAETPQPEPAPPQQIKPARSEAITLLAALQREARLVDFMMESLDGFSDAQIGAVARDVHRDCGAVLQRMFALRPLVEAEDGSTVEAPDPLDAARWRLSGNVSGPPPHRGALAHHGWLAAVCELPTWTGDEASALVVAPAEVEVS